MRVETQTEADPDRRTTVVPPTTPVPQSVIPWWEDLDPVVRAELHLPDIADEGPPAQPLDVVVIGAGVAGLSAALSARRAGARVLVLERNALIGCGTSGRNAGILSVGINADLTTLPAGHPALALWPATTEVLFSLIREAALPDSLLSLRLTGSLSLAETISGARNLAREVHLRLRMGLRAELWTPAQVAEATGGRLNVRTVYAALWLPDEARVHPLTLLAHLARRARRAGVELRGNAPVITYEEAPLPGGASGWRLHLANGCTLLTRGLILAVGPGARPTARLYALAFRAELPPDFPIFGDALPYTYADYRPGEGRLTVTGGRYGRAGVTRNDAHYHCRLKELTYRWLPELAEQEPAYTWAVDLEVAPQMVPELHPVGAVAPALAIEGLGALGMLPGMVLGERAGEQVASAVSR
ncbi:NAD(P)/FAD-dependent oxidoreductase [Thermogemmatispora onikobensis]|uniref:NAD(P)/FAD-dependent oxidoreductase n=1 Tax=Thermogemmatispora onikobensis TaxID=732234 RepID=UPI0008535A38|nr:FAD-dependent oxidoreductase [Thermogemmatispora onikobensis]